MNKTVAQTCELYPEIKAKLVEEGYYNMAASLKLNVVVVLVGWLCSTPIPDAFPAQENSRCGSDRKGVFP